MEQVTGCGCDLHSNGLGCVFCSVRRESLRHTEERSITEADTRQ